MPRFDVLSLVGDPELKKKIEAARREAHTEIDIVLERFMAAVEKGDVELTDDEDDSACLVLEKPSSGFRTAARAVGLIDYGSYGLRLISGDYPIMEFLVPLDHPAADCFAANELASHAAGLVMMKHFPNETWFVIEGRTTVEAADPPKNANTVSDF